MITVQCIICQHLKDRKKRICEFFPAGIPDDIYFGKVLHPEFKPIDGINDKSADDVDDQDDNKDPDTNMDK